MLKLVTKRDANRSLQKRLEERLVEGLSNVGDHAVSFRPTTITLPLHISGPSGLWWGTKELDHTSGEPRYWNAFGIFQPGKTQRISIEINIPVQEPAPRVAGFFASDPASGCTYLMHSGKIGGGLEGATKEGFLQWLGRELVEVSCPNKKVREGIIVGDIEEDTFVLRIQRFVQEAHAFKASLSQS